MTTWTTATTRVTMMLEALCGKCGETFLPADAQDITHMGKQDGSFCGGTGDIQGEWFTFPPSRPFLIELEHGYAIGLTGIGGVHREMNYDQTMEGILPTQGEGTDGLEVHPVRHDPETPPTQGR
jgi:hypothetical protein